MARVDPRRVPCPTVDIPCLDSSLDSHTGCPEVGEQLPRPQAQSGLVIWARGQSDWRLLGYEFCCPGRCVHPLPPKGLISNTHVPTAVPTASAQCPGPVTTATGLPRASGEEAL